MNDEFLEFARMFAIKRPLPKDRGDFEEYVKNIWDRDMVDCGNGKRKVK